MRPSNAELIKLPEFGLTFAEAVQTGQVSPALRRFQLALAALKMSARTLDLDSSSTMIIADPTTQFNLHFASIRAVIASDPQAQMD